MKYIDLVLRLSTVILLLLNYLEWREYNNEHKK